MNYYRISADNHENKLPTTFPDVLVLDSILDRFGVIDLPLKHDSLQNLPRSSERELSWPNLRVCKVAFPDLKVLDSDVISCLQLTETKLYASVISGDRLYERIENMWCYDFGSPLSVK